MSAKYISYKQTRSYRFCAEGRTGGGFALLVLVVFLMLVLGNAQTNAISQ